jgi:predicted NAD/FAD-binding protein
MKIAIIGGGASGLVTAYLLDRHHHDVTLFEKQPILGGHIRTLNKNVKPDRGDCNLFLEGGVLEFPVVFYNFLKLMVELGVELEPVNINSGLFFQDGRYFLSAGNIDKNFGGWQRAIEYLRLDGLYARSAPLWMKVKFASMPELYDRPLSAYLQRTCVRTYWLKLLIMYSYSMSFELLDNFPAELAIPILRDYVFVDWVRVKGGVYSYVEKILDRFRGKIYLQTHIIKVIREDGGVKIVFSDGRELTFDRVVFATPPDCVLPLLAAPTDREIRRFGAWQKNIATTTIHTDTSMYAKYGIEHFSEFDFFQTSQSWGYNAYLNHLCGVAGDRAYSLAFNLDDLIDRDRVIQRLEHHTPLYTLESFRYRDEIVETNGENYTYYVGAYLSDGLHEGAIVSALRVAKLIG